MRTSPLKPKPGLSGSPARPVHLRDTSRMGDVDHPPSIETQFLVCHPERSRAESRDAVEGPRARTSQPWTRKAFSLCRPWRCGVGRKSEGKPAGTTPQSTYRVTGGIYRDAISRFVILSEDFASHSAKQNRSRRIPAFSTERRLWHGGLIPSVWANTHRRT